MNVIVYANYGEQNAQIVHGRDHDYPDIRSHAHNTFIKSRIADLAAEARRVIEEAEQKQVMRIKCLIREYYLTKSEAVKKEFEEANTVFPFLFSRAFLELRMERATAPPVARAPRRRLCPTWAAGGGGALRRRHREGAGGPDRADHRATSTTGCSA